MQSLRHCMTSMFSAYSPTITIGNAFAFRLKNACNAHVGTLVGTIEGVLRMCFRKLFAARIICASDEGPRLPSSDNSPALPCGSPSSYRQCRFPPPSMMGS